jgi:hypothetical protein
MVATWNKAVNDFGGDMERAIAWWDDIEEKRARYWANLKEMEANPITIRIKQAFEGRLPEESISESDQTGRVPGFAAGGQFLVGEQGPELVTIRPTGRTTNVNSNNVNTFNINDQGAMHLLLANQQRDRAQAFERNSM